jgi:hypothetical protein
VDEEEGVPKEDNSVGKNRFLSFGDLQVVETLTGYSSTVRSLPIFRSFQTKD